MIIEASRGSVRFSVNGRTITVSGEQYFPDDKPSFFVAYVKTLDRWEDGGPVEPGQIDAIKKTLDADFAAAGRRLVWEQ